MTNNKVKYLVSSCLVGKNCRYDGKSQSRDFLLELYQRGEVIDVCPEELAGLGTPRPPAEQQGAHIVNVQGQDVTLQFQQGAAKAAAAISNLKIEKAYLKSKSPMCGCGLIYDGNFNGKLKPGDGVFTALLKQQFSFGIESVD